MLTGSIDILPPTGSVISIFLQLLICENAAGEFTSWQADRLRGAVAREKGDAVKGFFKR